MPINEQIPGYFKLQELKVLEKVAEIIEGPIVECGSFLGRSSFVLASSAKNSEVHCIDNWQWGIQNIRPDDLAKIDGDLSLYTGDPKSTFENSIREFANVTAHLGNTLDPWNLSPEMVFLDSDHRFEHVRQELEVWYPRLTRNGFLCGHDFHPEYHPGVIRAIWDFNSSHAGKNFSLFVAPKTSLWFLMENPQRLAELSQHVATAYT